MIRVAIVLVLDRTGNFFVHRRRSDKRVFPNLCGLGAGGLIEEGETPLAGAARELHEETGLDGVPLPVDVFPFENAGVRYTVHLFHVVSDRAIDNHDPEWSWSAFLTERQVEDLARAGELCPDTEACLRRFQSARAALES